MLLLKDLEVEVIQNSLTSFTFLSHFTFSFSQIMLSLFSKVSVDNGLKRNLEQREVRGSIILQDKM